MGEYAEMMLDGTLCEGCGCFLQGHGDGVPRYCKGCRKDRNMARHEAEQQALKKAACALCGKKVKTTGMFDHLKDAHGVKGVA